MVPDFYIDPSWMDSIRNSVFFYPAAGPDYAEPLKVLQDYIDTFWFGDLHYPRGLVLQPVFPAGAGFRLVDQKATGDLDAEIKQIESYYAGVPRKYRFLPPSYLTEIYERADSRRITVVRRTLKRRGTFFLLLALPDGSRTLVPANWTDWKATEAVDQASGCGTLQRETCLAPLIDLLPRSGSGRPERVGQLAALIPSLAVDEIAKSSCLFYISASRRRLESKTNLR
jgi:hypothetical protein